ncbi:hypothetical protein ACIBMZ_06840 [Micromonospora sp. NPDC049900]
MSGGTGAPAAAGAEATDDGEQSSGSPGEHPAAPLRRTVTTGAAARGAAV